MSFANEPQLPPKMDLPTPSVPSSKLPSRRRRRRWWRWLALGTVLVIVAAAIYVVGPRYFRHQRAVAEFDNAVADLNGKDPGWRLRDLEAARPTVPDIENSAFVVSEAFRRLPRGGPVPQLLDRFATISPQERLGDEDTVFLRDELSKVETARREARKVANMPRGRYPIAYPSDPADEPAHDHEQNTRPVFSLLKLDVLQQAQDGDVNGALRSCRAVLNTGRALGDEPHTVAQLLRITAVAINFRLVERVLAQGEPDAADLVELEKLLEQENNFPRLVVMMRSHRAHFQEIQDALRRGDMTVPDVDNAGNLVKTTPALWDRLAVWDFNDSLLEAHAEALALHSEAVRLAAIPAHERVVRSANFETELRPLSIVRLLAPTYFPKLDMAARRTDSQLRCLIVALAMERFRLRHGDWPTALDQLAPEMLLSIPLDPQDGEPLRLQRLPDRVVIYSKCEVRGADDLPHRYDPDEPSPPGVGVAVHLFDVQHRRQPPRPKPPPEPSNDGGPR
jgi:hypothetical protein